METQFIQLKEALPSRVNFVLERKIDLLFSSKDSSEIICLKIKAASVLLQRPLCSADFSKAFRESCAARKIRIIKYCLDNNIPTLFDDSYESKLLDEVENLLNAKIERQFNLYGTKLKADGRIADVLIEIDGRSHFENVYDTTGEILNEVKRRDSLKEEWALKNNFKLLRFRPQEATLVAKKISSVADFTVSVTREVLQALKAAAEFYGHVPSSREYESFQKSNRELIFPSLFTIKTRFGYLNACKQVFGEISKDSQVQAAAERKRNIIATETEELKKQIVENFRRAKIELGDIPSCNQYSLVLEKLPYNISARRICNRFKWKELLIEVFGEQEYLKSRAKIYSKIKKRSNEYTEVG